MGLPSNAPHHLPAEAGESPLRPIRCMRMLCGIRLTVTLVVHTRPLSDFRQSCRTLLRLRGMGGTCMHSHHCYVQGAGCGSAVMR